MNPPTKPLKFSPEAVAVFDAGRELWRYYHTEAYKRDPEYNVNASLYDIREYFKGRNAKGKMNRKSADVRFNELDKALRDKLEILALKIKPKVYKYGFLKPESMLNPEIKPWPKPPPMLPYPEGANNVQKDLHEWQYWRDYTNSMKAQGL